MTQFNPLSIAGVGLATALDAEGAPDATAALAEILAGTPTKRRHPNFIGADGIQQLCAPVMDCLNTRDLVDRTAHLARIAHADLGGIARPGRTLLLLSALLGPGAPFVDKTHQMIQAGAFGVIPDEIYFGGAAEAAGLLVRMSEDIGAGRLQSAVLVCADTRIAPFVLDLMAAQNLAPVRAAKYQPLPGEAGIAIHVTAANTTQPHVSDLLLSHEPADPTAPGRGLMGLSLGPALKSFGDLPPGTKVIADTDGPRHKAEELGVVLGSVLSLEDEDLVVPSLSLGAVGCPTLLVFLVTAIECVEGGAPVAIGWVSGLQGARYLFCVRAP
ncbi:hypothetical protein BC777_3894 [Yoonia maricola]|uniref:3-oxoacyl-[acyl-carrier-protein] synthase-1 n=1 Tax=Yoonia maricola TaxID=420999 RepID=A0A2M8W0B2_9RHOB|nr:hypothetical protein [Yoonia maricola]PJI84352.1 hypothetical protein BC777_3894 [Yoonia maricola]